jgi:hypothetical protein
LGDRERRMERNVRREGGGMERDERGEEGW